MGSAPVSLLEFEQALQLVMESAARHGSLGTTERLPLPEVLGRVLAEPILADRDQPAFDRSTRDGFAVRASDLLLSTPLPVAGEIKAGASWSGTLPPGSALAIMTGAPVPPGADAVVMIEHVLRTDEGIRIAPARTLIPGENVVPRGREARAGASVLPAGTRLGPAEIALAASCGLAQPLVFRRPRVAIVATGDELVDLHETPGPQQIRNSNSYGLAALVAAAGGEPLRLPVAADTRESVRARIHEGCTADLLLFSGGVSMGEYDLVEEALEVAGATFLCTGVRMQPGKPVVFGYLPTFEAGPDSRPGTFFFGLPGNPISTEVTFRCFAELFLRTLAGEPAPAPPWALASLAEAVAGKPGLTRLLPARLEAAGPGSVEVRIVPWQGSGDMAANARANCYAELLPGRDYRSGESIRVLLR